MTTSPPSETDLEVPSARLERTRLWLRAIAGATDLLIVGGTPEPDVVSAMGELQKVTGAERVIIQVTRQSAPLDESQMMLRVLPEHVPARVLPLSDRWRWKLAAGELVLCQTQDLRPAERRTLYDHGIRSCALVPLKVGGILRGCTRLENAEAMDTWSPDELLALASIGTVFSNALGYREAREMLDESAMRLRRLVDNAPDMIYRMSLPDGRYEVVSPAATSMTGHTPEEFLTTPKLIERILHPGWRSYFEHQWALLLQGEVPLEYAYAIVHGQTGETRWLHQRNVLIRDAYGRPVALEGIVTDVTQRQVTEARLRSRESTLQTILSSAPIGIGFNSDRTLLMVNDELCRMTGYTSEELVGKVTDFLYPTYKEFQRVGVDLVAQLEQGTTGSVETQWVRKDGTVLDVLLSANCITPEDYALGVTFTVLDITRFRRG